VEAAAVEVLVTDLTEVLWPVIYKTSLMTTLRPPEPPLGVHILKARASLSVGSSTHCDPSALFILGVHTVRICDIELKPSKIVEKSIIESQNFQFVLF
jgi:hypothetical protein